VILACAFDADESAASGIRALLENGLPSSAIRVGAIDRERTRALRAQFGVGDELDAADPLAGVADLAAQPRASGAIDRGAVVGAVVGTAIGVAVGLTPGGKIMPVAGAQQALADGLLCFALGAIAGASLGGALGPRRSSHVGYRIIDALDAGAIAVVAEVPDAVVEIAVTALEFAGAHDVLRIPG